MKLLHEEIEEIDQAIEDLIKRRSKIITTMHQHCTHPDEFRVLDRLYAYGVDNWEWYGDALRGS